MWGACFVAFLALVLIPTPDNVVGLRGGAPSLPQLAESGGERCSPTGLAITMLQGMYAGTPEKEATRDTYQGYVIPEVTAKIQAASAEADPARRTELLNEARAIFPGARFPDAWGIA